MQDAWIPLVTDLLAKECIVLCGLLQKGKTRGQREGHQSQEWAVLVILEHHFHQLLVRACWGLWISDQQFPKIKDLPNLQFVCTADQGASLVSQSVKNPPAMQETWVQSLVRKIPWRRQWQPTAVFLPGKSYGQRSLESYSPWGHKRWTQLSD